jgi:hypothetical protein
LGPFPIPPPGIEPILAFIPPFSVCLDEKRLQPGDDHTFAAAVEVAQTWTFCVDFPAGPDIDVSVTGPDGKTMSSHLSAGGAQDLVWSILPDEAVGAYELRAQQGNLLAQGNLTVGAATHPRLAVRPASGPIGQEFAVGIAGLTSMPEPPEDRYRVYRSCGAAGQVAFVGWRSMTIEAPGQGVDRFRTGPGDIVGTYMAVTGSSLAMPPCDTCAVFDLTGPWTGIQPCPAQAP